MLYLLQKNTLKKKVEEIKETLNEWQNKICFVNLDEEAIRQEKRAVRTRQNTTDNIERKQQEETEFKRKILKQYWKYYNIIFKKRISDELSLL